jgi:hypothetical protein
MAKVILTHGFCYVPGGVVPNVYNSVKITFEETYTIAVTCPTYPLQQSVFYIRNIQHMPNVIMKAILFMKDLSTPQQIIDKITELFDEFQKDMDEMESILRAKLIPKLDQANRAIAELRESQKQGQAHVASLEKELEQSRKREEELSTWGEIASIHLDALELTNRELQLQIDNADRINRDAMLEDAISELSI